MKRKSLPFITFKPLFFGNIYVCFREEDYEMWDEFKPPVKSQFLLDTNLAQCTHYTDRDMLISIDPTKQPDFPSLCESMAHESLHATEWLFRDVGDKEPSEEVRCRILGQITGFVMSEYLKQRKLLPQAVAKVGEQ